MIEFRRHGYIAQGQPFPIKDSVNSNGRLPSELAELNLGSPHSIFSNAHPDEYSKPSNLQFTHTTTPKLKIRRRQIRALDTRNRLMYFLVK